MQYIISNPSNLFLLLILSPAPVFTPAFLLGFFLPIPYIIYLHSILPLNKHVLFPLHILIPPPNPSFCCTSQIFLYQLCYSARPTCYCRLLQHLHLTLRVMHLMSEPAAAPAPYQHSSKN